MKPILLNTALSCLFQPGYHLYYARQQANKMPDEEAGLTLLECVVAIAVIALTGAMIGPPLVMAAATRVQTRRAEQALQLAQGEVDRVRAMVVRGQGNVNLLPDISTEANLEGQGAPTTTSGQLRTTNETCPDIDRYDATDASHVPALIQALPVDVDGDCDAEFLVQSFRYPLEFEDDDTVIAQDFQMMVRVYSARASNHFDNLEVEEASLGFTSGEGDYWKKPLAVLTTRVNQSDTDVALCGYHGLNSANADGEDDGDCR
ncbi:MAG: type II secretion system protein [Cyanothece sp. SIO2G6]|nr:type II secretion system protein [Cyanothece sp. SIO2G6]